MVIQKGVSFSLLQIKNLNLRVGLPSHIGITYNEKANSAAKWSLGLPRVKVCVPSIDFKYHIRQYILTTWQDDWNGEVANKR